MFCSLLSRQCTYLLFMVTICTINLAYTDSGTKHCIMAGTHAVKSPKHCHREHAFHILLVREVPWGGLEEAAMMYSWSERSVACYSRRQCLALYTDIANHRVYNFSIISPESRALKKSDNT